MKRLARQVARRFGYRLRPVDPYFHPGAIRKFNADPDNPYLISFPRTGSHWLRMLVELYYERPLLVRSFYFPHRTDFLLVHDHDMDLQVDRRSVLYLFRNPVDTIYSQLSYHREPLDSPLRIAHWAGRYALHLAKWLVDRRGFGRFTVLRYEAMKADLSAEFARVIEHLGGTFDADRLQHVQARVTREEVKDRVTYNDQVMTLGDGYESARDRFRREQDGRVWDAIRAVSHTVYGDADAIPRHLT